MCNRLFYIVFLVLLYNFVKTLKIYLFKMKKISALLCASLMFISGTYAKDMVYHDATKFPLYGSAVKNDSLTFTRLPDSLKTKIRKELYDLGTNTAGLFIRFSSDAKKMKVKWNSTYNLEMNHMAPSGIRGFDVYTLMDDGHWEFVSPARPVVNKKSCTATVFSNMKPGMREYMMFFPLYDGADSLYIGVDSAAVIEMPKVDLPKREKPVVIYGTSITQGACASRPGMCHTNMLVRDLNREVYNLGFSGNGRFDLEVAEVMVSIDAGLYVIDCLANNKVDEIKKKVGPFFQYLRAHRPEVPILFVESPMFPGYMFDMDEENTLKEKNAALREYYEKLKKQDVKNIYYFEAKDILTEDRQGTVDGYHFTDLGFYRYEKNILPVIEALIK